jgi:hypothetical protein
LLDRFLEHQGITPTGIVGRESPDFLVDLDGRVVGIEVTELFTQRCNSDPHLRPEGPLLQAREQVCTQIVSKAREIYFDTNNPPVLSHILFSDRIIPADKRKGDQIAKLIADQIQGMSRQDSETAEWRSREDEKEENPLSEWVSFISACRVPERFARWSPNSAGLVFPLAPARLQEEIDQKVPKLNAYKECAEEIWLLIVADRTRSSQKISIMPDFPLDSISSPFAKTFYYDYVHGKVLSFEAGCPTSRF